MLAWYQKNRKKTAVVYGIVYVISCYVILLSYIPKEVTVAHADDEICIAAPVTVTQAYDKQSVAAEHASAAKGGTKDYVCKLFGVIPIASVHATVAEEQMVNAVGQPVGIYMKTKGVYVAGIKELVTSAGEKSSPCAYVLQEGDYITAVNGMALENKEQLQEQVQQAEENAMVLSVVRNKESMELRVVPKETEDGVINLVSG
ncbi:MAG: site-2 protease family protein [Lachnospiraceae bacterium]|nr:site-2 protease family protein [Lachnospiraceae bacterium]